MPRGFARGRLVGIVEIVGELLGSSSTHRPFKMNPKDSWIEHLLLFLLCCVGSVLVASTR